MKITEKAAKQVLNLLSKGLPRGLGKPKEGEMCVEACVAYAFGEIHSDQPRCVATYLTPEMIALNDYRGWSSREARAKGLRRAAIAQLGSAKWGWKQQDKFERIFKSKITTLLGGKDDWLDLFQPMSLDAVRALRRAYKWDGDTAATKVADLMAEAMIEVGTEGATFTCLVDVADAK